jgi:transposase-like protein
MECLECKSANIHKPRNRRDKQNHICIDCHRQFIDEYSLRSSYPDEIKRDCLKMYVNSIWDRGIEGVNGIHHTIIISWVKQVEVLLLPAYSGF